MLDYVSGDVSGAQRIHIRMGKVFIERCPVVPHLENNCSIRCGNIDSSVVNLRSRLFTRVLNSVNDFGLDAVETTGQEFKCNSTNQHRISPDRYTA